MKKDDFDVEFVEKFSNIDFSAESKSKEKNLEKLKANLKKINKERDFRMNKRIRKPAVIAVAAIIILSLSMVVYGQDIVNAIRNITLGNHAEFVVAGQDAVPLPEELIGQLFDAEGNILNYFPETRELFDANGVHVGITFEGDTLMIMSVEELMERYSVVTCSSHFDFLEFHNIKEGAAHFITDVLMPAYLPDGYEFEKVSFFVSSLEELAEYGANKYMTVHISDGEHELRWQVRFMDETSGFIACATQYAREIQINGHNAVVDMSTVNILIGDVMYMFFANENVDVDGLIRIAESLR